MIASWSALDLAAALRRRECSAVEAFDAVAAQVRALNPAVNAIVRFDPEAGRAEARAADRRLAAGDAAPLLGVPFTVKDTLWVAGRQASQGSARFAGFVAPEDAPAVARLRAAGGVFLGHTNCSEFACKGVTTNPLFGATRNPWDLQRTTGGSSGGAAAALAAGFGPLALATDGGGSTRRPAAHCGVVGFKPSAHAVPHAGGFAEPVFGNAVIGPMARSVADVVALFQVLSGIAPEPLRAGTRIAFSPAFGLDVPVDEDVAACVEGALSGLPGLRRADPAWPAGAGEAALMPLQWAGLAALHGDALGAWNADPDIAAQIEAGLKLSGVDVARALFAREAVVQAFDRFFADHDLLVSPTTPCTAWPLGQPGPARIGGRPVAPRAHAAFTPLVNHAHLPAVSVPCGLDRDGLPVGLQIVGRRGADAQVLALAALVERHVPFQSLAPSPAATV